MRSGIELHCATVSTALWSRRSSFHSGTRSAAQARGAHVVDPVQCHVRASAADVPASRFTLA